MDHAVKVATVNVWCRHGDWHARRKVLRAGFDALQADLVALQETVVDGDDQVRELFGDEYHVLHQGRRTTDGVGCSIVARWPAVRTTEIDLLVTDRVDPADFPGRTTAAEFDTPLGPVLFVHHKPNWQITYERERDLQALKAAQAVESLVGDRSIHVILAGDFDARPESSSIRFWTGRQPLGNLSVHYQDAWEFAHPGEAGHTFSLQESPLVVAEADWSRIPPRRIDYIMVRCDERGPTLRIESCERLFDKPVDGTFATDHFGVTAHLSGSETA
jgi:endonuclease/exonuclease/phosphatase family metal-dependent hydrolase